MLRTVGYLNAIKKLNMFFKIALLIFFYCPERRSFIQLINPPLSKNCTCRGDML